MNPSSTMWQATLLVAGRELSVRLRDKTFLFSTAIFLVMAAGVTLGPALFDNVPTVAVPTGGTSAPAVSALREAGLTVREVADRASAERLVRDDEVDAAVVATAGGGDEAISHRFTVLAVDDAPSDVVRALSSAPQVQLLDPDAVDPVLRFMVPMAFAMIFFFTSQAFGVQIAQSVTEEKQTRIVEILVAAVPARALLAGKVLATGALALGQVALLSLVAAVGLRASGNQALLTRLGPALGWFIPFFLTGFVLLAAMWAVAGALVSRQEDIAGASMPVQMLVMLPFFGVIFLSDNPLAMTVLSYLPFSAPTAMPVRLFFGDAAGWEVALSLAVLLGTAVVFILLGARVYEGSLLRTNGRTSLRTAWRQRRAHTAA